MPFFIPNMKRYYIAKSVSEAESLVPILVVAGNWHKRFNTATRAKRAVPPYGRHHLESCRGWYRSMGDSFSARSLNATYVELHPSYLSQAMVRLRRSGRWFPWLTGLILPLYMIIPAIDYSRLKTNYKLGAPKGRLP